MVRPAGLAAAWNPAPTRGASLMSGSPAARSTPRNTGGCATSSAPTAPAPRLAPQPARERGRATSGTPANEKTAQPLRRLGPLLGPLVAPAERPSLRCTGLLRLGRTTQHVRQQLLAGFIDAPSNGPTIVRPPVGGHVMLSPRLRKCRPSHLW